MKKRFTLSYAEIDRKHKRQSRGLICVGAILISVAIFASVVALSGARRAYSVRQSLIAILSERFSQNATSDDKLALAGADINAYMLGLLEEARVQKLATLDNQRVVLANQDSLAPAEPHARGYTLYEGESGRMARLLNEMLECDKQALLLKAELEAIYAPIALDAEFSRGILSSLADKQIADAAYELAQDERKARKSEQSKANKALRDALKPESGATEADIAACQAAYDEATRVYEQSDNKKDEAYSAQQAAIARLRGEYARALESMPGMSAYQSVALTLSSVVMLGVMYVLGAELCLIGWACLRKPKRVPMSVLTDVLIYDFFVVLGAVMLAPLLYVAVGSFSSTGLAQFRFGRFDLSAYRMIAFSARTIRTVGNSFIITIVGTLMNIVITSITAYALSKRDLPGRGWMMKLVIVFMLFHAGLIPDYMLIANRLGLTNTYWAIWLPVLISSSNLIIMKNFFQQLPESIEESARIDGCNEIQSFVHIVLPMSMASIATFSLFYAVGHWNNYQRAMIYITDLKKYPITVLLRQVVILSQGSLADDVLPEVQVWAPTSAVKYATIIVGTVPIICVYPFLQKHFTKGVLLGSVKG